MDNPPQLLPLLSLHCVLVLLASLAGGWLPLAVRLTHELLSFEQTHPWNRHQSFVAVHRTLEPGQTLPDVFQEPSSRAGRIRDPCRAGAQFARRTTRWKLGQEDYLRLVEYARVGATTDAGRRR